MSGSEANPVMDQLSHGYRIDRQLGLVFDRMPSGTDDLTLVRGIDTREAVQLNRLGVYQFAQIATWERTEIRTFADELGMSVSSLTGERWVEQAHRLCLEIGESDSPSPPVEVLPASFIRTATLLVFATLIGCFVVYGLSLQREQCYQGVLAAEITSLRVPAESRLVEAHVAAGDEVFSGKPLLTLEKIEHLTMIQAKEMRVQELRQQLQRAKAQASLDLEWRVRDVESEIIEMQSRVHMIEEIERDTPQLMRSVSLPQGDHPYSGRDATFCPVDVELGGRHIKAKTVSMSSEQESQTASERVVSNRLMFFASSGASSPLPLPPQPSESTQRTKPLAPVPAIQSPPVSYAGNRPPTQVAMVGESHGKSSVLQLESKTVQQRLERLEDLRDLLPDQVRQAAGVEALSSQLSESEAQLKLMKGLSREVDVICPGYGRVGQVRYRAGECMGVGETMLKILHTDRRYISVQIPTSEINRVQPGDLVDLIFPNDRIFTGRVTDLPMIAEMSSKGHSAATVRIEHTGKLWAEVPIGSQIDVRVR